MTEAAQKTEIEILPERRSPLKILAQKMGADEKILLDTIKNTLISPRKNGAPISNEEVLAFLVIATKYDLDPIARQIYAFPGKNGGIVTVVSVDGWAAIIHRQPNFKSMKFSWEHGDKGELVSCTCLLSYKDGTDLEITEWLRECYRDTEPWRSMPHRMLRHKAMIQAGRIGFGLAGIHDEDEALTISGIEAEQPQQPPIGKNRLGGNGHAALPKPQPASVPVPVEDLVSQETAAKEPSKEPEKKPSPEQPKASEEIIAEISKHRQRLGLSDDWLKKTLAENKVRVLKNLTQVQAETILARLIEEPDPREAGVENENEPEPTGGNW